MKAQYKILTAMIAIMTSSTVFAELPQKSATRIEFNSMIDKNNMDKQNLQKTVANKMVMEPEVSASADQRKVLDLVDIEVGVGEDRPVVSDRRFNSIGEPVVDSRFNSVNIILPDGHKEDSGS